MKSSKTAEPGECRSCEYCDLTHNQCYITEEVCYNDHKCLHDDCKSYREGTISAMDYDVVGEPATEEIKKC